MRLQKFLARAGAASRRGSENLMTAGRVTVNGEVVTELGSKVDPLVDEVAVDGVVYRISDKPVTLMLNKPAGFLTTMTDPFGRPCVAGLVPLDRYPGLYPVGRLDGETTGLLLFSTDGELGHALLHPRRHVEKRYEATIEGVLEDVDVGRLEEGIELEDGMTLPARVELGEMRIEGQATVQEVAIYLHEGRKRQVRRMFEAVGHPVCALRRTDFGPLSLGGLQEGGWRLLTEEEQILLQDVIASGMPDNARISP